MTDTHSQYQPPANGTPSEDGFDIFGAPEAEPPTEDAVDTPEAELPTEDAVDTPEAELPTEDAVDTPEAEPPTEDAVDTPEAEPPTEDAVDTPEAEPLTEKPKKKKTSTSRRRRGKGTVEIASVFALGPGPVRDIIQVTGLEVDALPPEGDRTAEIEWLNAAADLASRLNRANSPHHKTFAARTALIESTDSTDDEEIPVVAAVLVVSERKQAEAWYDYLVTSGLANDKLPRGHKEAANALAAALYRFRSDEGEDARRRLREVVDVIGTR